MTKVVYTDCRGNTTVTRFEDVTPLGEHTLRLSCSCGSTGIVIDHSKDRLLDEGGFCLGVRVTTGWKCTRCGSHGILTQTEVR